MSEPSCKIDWFYEGYRQVWLYQAPDVPDDAFEEFCHGVAEAIEPAETIEALATAIEGVATAQNVVVRQYPGPSHGDPLRNTFRVGVFGRAPAEWPATEARLGR